MFAGLLASLMVLPNPPISHSGNVKVENGIIVIRPDPNVRYALRIIPPDPLFHDPMPGAENPRQATAQLMRDFEQRQLSLLEVMKRYAFGNEKEIQAIEAQIRQNTELIRKLEEELR